MDDFISRQAAIDAIMGQPTEPHYPSWYAEQIKNLPSAQRKGKWMHDKDDLLISGYCSCCGWESINMETDVADMPYCPNCGAEMKGEDDETTNT